MDSEHVAPKRVDSRIVPVAVDRWKAVFKETKGHWSREGRGHTGVEEGEEGREQRGRQWLCSLGLFNVSMRNGIVSGPLDFVTLLKFLPYGQRLFAAHGEPSSAGDERLCRIAMRS
jgi:hypothetical protein